MMIFPIAMANFPNQFCKHSSIFLFYGANTLKWIVYFKWSKGVQMILTLSYHLRSDSQKITKGCRRELNTDVQVLITCSKHLIILNFEDRLGKSVCYA